MALDDLGDGCSGQCRLVPGLLPLLDMAARQGRGVGRIQGPSVQARSRRGLGRGPRRRGRRVHEHRRRGAAATATAAWGSMMAADRARGWGGWDFLAPYSGPGGGRWGTGPGDGFIRTVASATRATARAKKTEVKRCFFRSERLFLFFICLFVCCCCCWLVGRSRRVRRYRTAEGVFWYFT